MASFTSAAPAATALGWVHNGERGFGESVPAGAADLSAMATELVCLAPVVAKPLGRAAPLEPDPFASAAYIAVPKSAPCVESIQRIDKWMGRKPPLIKFVAKMQIGEDPLSVLRLLNDFAIRKQWDPNCAFLRVVSKWEGEAWGGDCAVTTMGTNPALGGVISPRDFVSCGITRKAAVSCECSFSCATGFEHSDLPAQKGFTRGQTQFWAMVWVPDETEKGQYTVTYFVQCELNGWLPGRLVTQGTASVAHSAALRSAAHSAVRRERIMPLRAHCAASAPEPPPLARAAKRPMKRCGA